MTSVAAAGDRGIGTTPTQPRSADNTVHDLIAISNDLRGYLTAELRRRGYRALRPSFAPLLSLVSDEGVPQGRLAGELGVSVQAASQTVTLAEKAGYVTREPNPNDGRSKLVVISPLGRQVVEHGGEAIATRASQYGESIGERRLVRFEAALAELLRRATPARGVHAAAVAPSHRSVGAVIVLAERAIEELRASMAEGGHRGVRRAHTSVLVHVGQRGVRASEIARAHRVSRQAVSSTLHELEALGYLSRQRDRADGRGVVFVLTGTGRRLIDDYVDRIDAIERSYEKVLGRVGFAYLADTAHELRHRIRLAATMAQRGGTPPGATDSVRTDGELLELATDLHRWLGAVDAARVATLLGNLSIEQRGPGRPSTAPRGGTEVELALEPEN